MGLGIRMVGHVQIAAVMAWDQLSINLDTLGLEMLLC